MRTSEELDIVPALIEPMVSEPVAGSWYRFSWRKRASLAIGATLLVGLLVTARTLRPDPTGLGTHQQLGFPPCTFQQIFNRRCPACGMTTSWAYFVRGQWIAAWKSNAGGMLLATAAALAAIWMSISATSGRWYGIRPSDSLVLALCLVIGIVTTADWLLRMRV